MTLEAILLILIAIGNLIVGITTAFTAIIVFKSNSKRADNNSINENCIRHKSEFQLDLKDVKENLGKDITDLKSDNQREFNELWKELKSHRDELKEVRTLKAQMTEVCKNVGRILKILDK